MLNNFIIKFACTRLINSFHIKWVFSYFLSEGQWINLNYILIHCGSLEVCVNVNSRFVFFCKNCLQIHASVLTVITLLSTICVLVLGKKPITVKNPRKYENVIGKNPRKCHVFLRTNVIFVRAIVMSIRVNLMHRIKKTAIQYVVPNTYSVLI
jgi:hypothetical protein